MPPRIEIPVGSRYTRLVDKHPRLTQPCYQCKLPLLEGERDGAGCPRCNGGSWKSGWLPAPVAKAKLRAELERRRDA